MADANTHWSQTFVRRPVLALVISLVIALLGLASIRFLTIAQYPESASSVITVTTPYPGANAELVRGFVTVPLESAIASADGIEFLSSTSAQNYSTISAQLELNYDVNDATAQILTRINQVRNQLPEGSEDPVLTTNRGENSAYMYIAFTSETLRPAQINDVLVRNVVPRLEGIVGVQRAQIFLASSICASAGPVLPTGKNNSGSSVRQAALWRQSIVELLLMWGLRGPDAHPSSCRLLCPARLGNRSGPPGGICSTMECSCAHLPSRARFGRLPG